MKIMCLVVSLKDQDARRSRIEGELAGCPFTFFDAYDGRRMTSEKLQEFNTSAVRQRYNRTLLGGEIGCSKSHALIYEKMVKDRIPWVWILEDDVLLSDQSKDLLRGASGISNFDEDGIYFVGGQQDIAARPMLLKEKTSFKVGRVKFWKSPGAEKYIKRTCSYLVPLSVAEKMVEFTNENMVLADNWLAFYEAGCFRNIYITDDSLVVHPMGKHYTTTITGTHRAQGLRSIAIRQVFILKFQLLSGIRKLIYGLSKKVLF